MLRCSACGKEVERGMKECGGCGLPLTAYAVPVARPRKQRLGLFFWIVVIGFAGGLFGFIVHTLNEPREEAIAAQQEAAQKADRAATLKKIAALSTPRAFIAHCGQPARRDESRNGPELLYRNGPATMHVIFPKDWPHIMFQEHLYGKVYFFDAPKGLAEMGCPLDPTSAKPK